jgi:hypothetical protein
MTQPWLLELAVGLFILPRSEFPSFNVYALALRGVLDHLYVVEQVNMLPLKHHTALIGIHAQSLYSVECLFHNIDLGLYKRVGV